MNGLDSAMAMRATEALAGPGADVDDATLGDVQDYVNRTDYAEAWTRASRAIQAGGTDIRVLSPFLLGEFIARGPSTLPGLLAFVATMLGKGWAALRPTERTAQVADGSLSWLFRVLTVQIDFHSAVEDDTYRSWLAGLGDAGAATLEQSRLVRAALEAAVGKSARAGTQLSELEARVRATFVRPKVQPQDTPLAPDVTVVSPTAASPSPSPVAPPVVAPADAPPVARTIDISPAMELLLAKLAAFETLVARDDLARAAVVAEDVRAALETFDPKVYFPRLLSPYFRVLAGRVEDLAPYWDGIGSASWRALEQLYRVDLDAFVSE